MPSPFQGIVLGHRFGARWPRDAGQPPAPHSRSADLRDGQFSHRTVWFWTATCPRTGTRPPLLAAYASTQGFCLNEPRKDARTPVSCSDSSYYPDTPSDESRCLTWNAARPAQAHRLQASQVRIRIVETTSWRAPHHAVGGFWESGASGDSEEFGEPGSSASREYPTTRSRPVSLAMYKATSACFTSSDGSAARSG